MGFCADSRYVQQQKKENRDIILFEKNIDLNKIYDHKENKSTTIN